MPCWRDFRTSRNHLSEYRFRTTAFEYVSLQCPIPLGQIEELVKMIEDHDIQIVLAQETWLDASIPNPHIPNFNIISRRDRSERPNRGGDITLARCEINNMVFLKHSDETERS